jgi:hypothetical protein
MSPMGMWNLYGGCVAVQVQSRGCIEHWQMAAGSSLAGRSPVGTIPGLAACRQHPSRPWRVFYMAVGQCRMSASILYLSTPAFLTVASSEIGALPAGANAVWYSNPARAARVRRWSGC